MTAAGENGTHPATTPLSAETLPAVWQQVLTSVGTLFANDLGKANLPAIFGPNSLVIRFGPDYDKEREYCQAPERLTKIEQALQKVTGRNWLVRVESGPASGNGTPGGAAPAVSRPVESPIDRARRLREEAEKMPLIRRAMEVLGAQVVRVEDGFGAVPAAADGRPPAPDGAADGEEA